MQDCAQAGVQDGPQAGTQTTATPVKWGGEARHTAAGRAAAEVTI